MLVFFPRPSPYWGKWGRAGRLPRKGNNRHFQDAVHVFDFGSPPLLGNTFSSREVTSIFSLSTAIPRGQSGEHWNSESGVSRTHGLSPASASNLGFSVSGQVVFSPPFRWCRSCPLLLDSSWLLIRSSWNHLDTESHVFINIMMTLVRGG